jgi:eukaryotic-like serine/threonine-protein kinase
MCAPMRMIRSLTSTVRKTHRIASKPMLNPSQGRVVSHYELLESLGRGGMGEVYVALDLTLQRKVALKAVRRERRLDDTARGRLLREARILSQLDHPNICRVYDYIEHDGGEFLVMELIDGDSLREALSSGLPPPLRLRVGEQIAAALAAAHAAGVIHRDLKPENVMLLRDGNVKVLDFGIARSIDTPTATDNLASNDLIDVATTSSTWRARPPTQSKHPDHRQPARPWPYLPSRERARSLVLPSI